MRELDDPLLSAVRAPAVLLTDEGSLSGRRRRILIEGDDGEAVALVVVVAAREATPAQTSGASVRPARNDLERLNAIKAKRKAQRDQILCSSLLCSWQGLYFFSKVYPFHKSGAFLYKTGPTPVFST